MFRENGAVLKIKLMFLVALLSSMTAGAEVHESYTFLQKINHQEKNLMAFSTYRLLSFLFPHKPLYVFRMHEYYEQYEASMHQVTIDLKGSENRRLLTRFVDAKSRMKEILDAQGVFSKNATLELARVRQHLHEGIGDIAISKMLALTTTQRILYALAQMETQIVGVTEGYLQCRYLEKNTTAAMSHLKEEIGRFEKNIRLCTRYLYWNEKEKNNLKRLQSAWSVMKKSLEKPGLALIVNLGSWHLVTILQELRQAHDSYLQGQNR
jgi:hypothetical protein